MRLLVVEDDAVLRDGLQVGLSANGWTVDVVGRVEDALAALSSSTFDLVVLDLGLPDGDGLEVLRHIRARRMDVGVIILSARDAVVDRIEGLDTGADDYLAKPFDLDEVAARIRAVRRRMLGRAAPALRHGSLTLDPKARLAWLVGSIIAALAAPALLGLLVLGGLIWWSVGRGLDPARRLADMLIARGAEDLRPLDTPGDVRELRPMVAALNGLIDRLEASRRRQAEFTAAAAHELRTPLAGLRVQAQIAATARDPKVRSQAIAQIIASVDRTSILVSRLLDMARADEVSGQPPTRRWTPLAELAHLDAEACPARLELTPAAAAAELNVDPARIGPLFANLLANACTHARSRVRLDVDLSPGRASLIIEDDGAGVSETDLPRLGRRFHRGTGAAPGGAGLGLSIAEAAAAAHGWRVAYARSPMGGLQVAVHLDAGSFRSR